MKKGIFLKICIIASSVLALIALGAIVFSLSLAVPPVFLPDDVEDTTVGGIAPSIPEDEVATYDVNVVYLGATVEMPSYQIKSNEILFLTVDANQNYWLPKTITVTGATYTWTPDSNYKSAELRIFDPVGDVNIIINAYNTVNYSYTEDVLVTADGYAYDISFQGKFVNGTSNVVRCYVYHTNCTFGQVFCPPGVTYKVVGKTDGYTILEFTWDGTLPKNGVLDFDFQIIPCPDGT